MKCPTLLQALAALHANSHQYGLAQLREAVSRLHAFYSMPFAPGMLGGEEAIFAGWKFDRLKPYSYNRYDGKTEFGIQFTKYWMEYGAWTDSETMIEGSTLIPKTLSHFIDDCDRAGIPLTLTPYGTALLKGAPR